MRGPVPTEDDQHRGQHGEHRHEAQHRLQPDPRPQGLHQPDPQDAGGPDQDEEGVLHGQGVFPRNARQ